MARRPNQKLGIDTPAVLSTVPTLSRAECCLTAENAPNGMASPRLMSSAVTVRSNVLGSLALMLFQTGVWSI